MSATLRKAKPDRVAYDFDETAKKFGHDRTWVYRQVKAGRIRAITGFGKMLIPASEIERMVGGAQ